MNRCVIGSFNLIFMLMLSLTLPIIVICDQDEDIPHNE